MSAPRAAPGMHGGPAAPSAPPARESARSAGLRGLRLAMLVLGVLGLGVAAYTTYVHYAGVKPLCTGGNSCYTVQTSVYSRIAGIPVPVIGLVGYASILASLFAPERETTRMATAAMGLIGFGFSAYLTYREIFSIHAICEECVGSLCVIFAITCLAIWRFLRGAPAAAVPAVTGEPPGPPGTPPGGAPPARPVQEGASHEDAASVGTPHAGVPQDGAVVDVAGPAQGP